MSILIVEDNPLSATVLESNLAKQGWVVLRASDGRAALDLLGQSPDVELLITDIQMPEMDGLELIASIRARPEWKALPVLVATARASADLVTRAASLGVRHLAVKPFNVGQLVQQVRELLRAELPTLRSRQHVQGTLGVNEAGYRDLLHGFDELVAVRLAALDAAAAGDATAAGTIGAGLVELRESAALMGADRVVGAIDSVAAGGTTEAAASLGVLARELRRVRAALNCGVVPSPTTDSTDAPADIPAADTPPADEPAA